MDKLKAWWSSLTPEKIQRWMSAVGGRRFFLSLGAGIVTTILSWYAKITPEIYRDVILGTVGIYIAGNTFQKNTQIRASGTTHVAEAKATGTRPESNPSED